MCYINSTAASTLTGHIGDPPSELKLRLYADADFAGDKDTFRSTSWGFLGHCRPALVYVIGGKDEPAELRFALDP